MGYGDATRPTLLPGSNVEFFATLTGSVRGWRWLTKRLPPIQWAAEAHLEKHEPWQARSESPPNRPDNGAVGARGVER